jgi:hypothetical protein
VCRTWLTPQLEHEVTTQVLSMEHWQCGTVTAREVAEALWFKSFLPTTSTYWGPQDLEKELLGVAGADATKELEARDVLAMLSFTLSKGAAVASSLS